MIKAIRGLTATTETPKLRFHCKNANEKDPGYTVEEGKEKESARNDFKGTEIAAVVVISVVATCH